MKKVLTLTLLAAMLLGACQKTENQAAKHEQSRNRVIRLSEGEKTGSASLLFAMNVGHSSKDCKGCMTINGHVVHVNCMGNGHYCEIIPAVQLLQIGTSITATTTDTFGLTSEDFFAMPDRSLDYIDENNNRVFLNIPEQLVFRDSVTRQFTFTGLFITNTPEYSNN